MNYTLESLESDLCGEPGHTACHVAIWIRRTITWILLCIGTIGNVLSLVVFARDALKKLPTTVYLSFLAVSDMAFLWAGPFRSLIILTARVNFLELNVILCKTMRWAVHVSTCFSIWLLVLLTKERVIFTAFPMAVERHMTRMSAAVSALVTFLCVVVLNSHYLVWNWLYVTPEGAQTDVYANGTNESMVFDPICRSSTDDYDAFLTGPWGLIKLLVWNVIPLLLIISGNLVIGIQLWRQHRKVSSSTNRQNRGINSVTKTLIYLSIFFLLCNTPYFVFTVIFNRNQQSLTEDSFAIYQLVYAIVTSILFCNYTFNFCFYVWTGSVFRNEIKALFACLMVRNRREA